MRHRKVPEHIRAGSLLLNCVISVFFLGKRNGPTGKEGPDRGVVKVLSVDKERPGHRTGSTS